MVMPNVEMYFIFTLSHSHTLILVLCGSSSVGRATAFQAVGRGFEPRLPLLHSVALAKECLTRRSAFGGIKKADFISAEAMTQITPL